MREEEEEVADKWGHAVSEQKRVRACRVGPGSRAGPSGKERGEVGCAMGRERERGRGKIEPGDHFSFMKCLSISQT